MARDRWKNARLAFVCSGNICRSPMAAALAQSLLEAEGLSPLVISMGTLGILGRAADRRAIEAASELGLDLRAHRSQGLNPMLLNAADVTFYMSPEHAVALQRVAPRARLAALGDLAVPALPEIVDPIRGSLDDFRASRDLMRACIQRWMQRVGITSPPAPG